MFSPDANCAGATDVLVRYVNLSFAVQGNLDMTPGEFHAQCVPDPGGDWTKADSVTVFDAFSFSAAVSK